MTINTTNYRQYWVDNWKRQGGETPIQAIGSSARQSTSVYLSLWKMEIMKSRGKFYKFFLSKDKAHLSTKPIISEGMHPICCQSTPHCASVC